MLPKKELPMPRNSIFPYFTAVTKLPPDALAVLHGDSAHAGLSGTVRFYQTKPGVLIAAEVSGLPSKQGACQSPVFGFHIHSGMSCVGDASDPFAGTAAHYNPKDCPHPYHAGDLVPLFGNDGYAFSMFLTDRFSVKEIIGRTVVIHSAPDDFLTQPAGNSGSKIACGVISHPARN